MEFKKCRGHTSRVSPVELTAIRNTTSPKSCPLHNFITAISYERTILLRTSKRSVAASTIHSRARSIKISTFYPHARGLSPDTSVFQSNTILETTTELSERNALRVSHTKKQKDTPQRPDRDSIACIDV